jgi:hypothetical protein
MKQKILIITLFVVIIFVTGFVCGKVTKSFDTKNIKNTEVLMDKVELGGRYKKQTEIHLDSANSEMFNFVTKYYHTTPSLLPDYYTFVNGDTVAFTKENFFYYCSMYKITEHLSIAKTFMINGLMLDSLDTVK